MDIISPIKYIMDKMIAMETKDKVTMIASVIAALVSILGIIINLHLSKKQRTAQFISQNRVGWIQTFKEYMTDYIDKVGYFYDKSIPENISQYMQDIYKMTAKIKLHLNFQDEYDKEIINEIDILNKSSEKFMQFVKYKKDNSEKNFKIIIDYYEANERVKLSDFIGSYFFAKFNLSRDNVDEKIYDIYKELKENEDLYAEEFYQCISEYIDIDMKKSVRNLKQKSELILLLTQVYLKCEWEKVKYETKYGNTKRFNSHKIYKKMRNKVKDKINKLKGVNEKSDLEIIKRGIKLIRKSVKQIIIAILNFIITKIKSIKEIYKIIVLSILIIVVAILLIRYIHIIIGLIFIISISLLTNFKLYKKVKNNKIT